MQHLSQNGLIKAEDLYYMFAGVQNLKVLDATYAAINGGSPYDAFLSQRIENAQFFDIDVVADQDASLPHTVPSAGYFAACASALGISNDDHVVIYDQSGSYAAASRAWWLFRLFGHDRVYVMDGGLQSWIARGFRVMSGPVEVPEPGRFTANFRRDLLATRADVMECLQTRSAIILDARAPDRFHGLAPEPRAGMRRGHIPYSLNLPYMHVIERAGGYIKPAKDLEQIFYSELGLSADTPVIASCGSGVTACTLALAYFKISGLDMAIYDGSWAEWGDELSGTPIEISA